MRITTWAIGAACLVLAGCAGPIGKLHSPSAHIAAKPKSDLKYALKGCGELSELRDAAYAELTAKSKAHDANPSFQSAGEIADLKGEYNMLSSTMASKGCPA
jgi:hypothetical protein